VPSRPNAFLRVVGALVRLLKLRSIARALGVQARDLLPTDRSRN
jgi:hypothetical protein